METKDQFEVDILLVEDDPADAELTVRALQRANIANPIRVVRDGQEALDLMFGEGAYAGHGNVRPRVVLLDLKLPKVSGLEVLQRLKSDPNMRTIPVVVLSSVRDEPDVREAWTLGANSYIVKPLDFEQFSAAVGNIGLYWLLLNRQPGT